ncbi:putative DNA-binding transcriptional regulator AlpA [Rhizobium sp. BK529]|nr:putative DNA-binding transcriptional regulator AlpA [Rhizobium sp. BK529]TCS07037.1 CP4-57 regulatory protein AlpA [Rhizobium sp. BK418]
MSMTGRPISYTLLSASDVQKIAPVSNVTLWRWVRDGKFPAPIRVAKNNFWRSDEVGAWMDEMSTRRVASNPKASSRQSA